MFFRAVSSAFHQPCLQAVTPLIVPKESLTKCNGYIYFFQSLFLILSPVIAAALYPVLPLHWIIALDIIGTVAGISPLISVKILKLKQAETVSFSFLGEAKEGIRVLYQNKGVFYLMLNGGCSLSPMFRRTHFIRCFVWNGLGERRHIQER